MKRTDPLLLADILDSIDEIQETTPSQQEAFFRISWCNPIYCAIFRSSAKP